MRAALIALIACTALAAGCVPVSLQPIYSGGDTYFDPAFVGTWDDGSGGQWGFRAIGYQADHQQADPGLAESARVPTAYLVEYSDQAGESAHFRGYLTHIGDTAFLDLTPSTPSIAFAGGNALERMLSLTMHTWIKIELRGGKLLLSPVNTDWLKEYIRNGVKKQLPAYSYLEHDQPLLTGSTIELRDFVAAHLEDEGFFTSAKAISAFEEGSVNSSGVVSGANYDSQYSHPTVAPKTNP